MISDFDKTNFRVKSDNISIDKKIFLSFLFEVEAALHWNFANPALIAAQQMLEIIKIETTKQGI